MSRFPWVWNYHIFNLISLIYNIHARTQDSDSDSSYDYIIINKINVAINQFNSKVNLLPCGIDIVRGIFVI